MKRSVIIIVLSFVFSGIWQACIDDESVGFVREPSIIDIEAVQNTFYTDFGKEITIGVDVSQTGDGNIKYEWAWSGVNSYGEVNDSLRVISTDPVLRYAFKKLGRFKVRLKATNEDGSSYYFFDVYVRTAYETGLLVLSKDENNFGRTSFLRVIKAEEIVTGNDEKFILHAFEDVNPEIKLNDPQDIIWGNDMVILSDGGKTLLRYDVKSFDFLNSIPVDGEVPGLRLKKICSSSHTTAGVALGWGMNRDIWFIDYNIGIVTPDGKFSPGEKFDKVYLHAEGNNALFVNFEEAYINHATGMQWPSPRFTSGEYFKEKNIVNLVGDVENKLCVITTDPEDIQSVTITSFNNMNAISGFPPFFMQIDGGFINPKTDKTYRAEVPLTLTREADMLVNKTYRVILYTRGKELYQWIYSGGILPETPLLTLTREITCMTLSPDENYLYLGIWNPLAKEELKGSVYIMDMRTSKIVKEHRGIADKPMKIIFKS